MPHPASPTSPAPPPIPLRILARRKLEVLGARGLQWTVRRMSRPKALQLADDLAKFAWRVPTLQRNFRRATARVEEAFGEALSPVERQEVVRGSVRSLARTMVDFLRFPLYSREEFLALSCGIEGIEHYHAFLESDIGAAVGLGMHLGSWEYAGVWWAHHHPMVAAGKAQRDAGITDMAVAIRNSSGIDHFLSQESSRKLVETLRRKDRAMLGLIADQNGGRNGIWVPLFGRLASSAKGPGFLMRRYNVPAMLLVSVWEGDQYRLIFGPRLDSVKTEDADHDALVNTARVQATFEGIIRQYPEQWLWLHDRFKSRPELVPEEERSKRILTVEEWERIRVQFPEIPAT